MTLDTFTDAWKQLGNCRDVPAGTMFPEVLADVPAAEAVCEGCPVLTECATHADTHREVFGVWGGINRTPNTSMRVLRTRRRTPEQASNFALLDRSW